MTAEELLTQPELQLPMARSDGDFLAFARDALKKYRNHVNSLAGADTLTQAAIACQQQMIGTSNSVARVLNAYFQGLPRTAYNILDAAIRRIRPHLDRLRSPQIAADRMRNLYRFRLQISPPLSREQLFHIPFELRHKVGTQRYSIPGLPCLYFGGSTFASWAEMRQPAFAEIQAACFWIRPAQAVNFIDFGHRPRWLSTWLTTNGGAPLPQNAIDYIVSHIVCWPLMAMASVKTRFHEDAFKPEYVIPQILLQWISQQPDVNGIRYFSTHIDYVTDNPHWICNYVFPARTVAPKGRCTRLLGLFKMTEPINWQLLANIHLDHFNVASMDNFDFQFIKGISEPYQNTQFGIVQGRLNELANRIKLANVVPVGQPGHNPTLGDVQP